jgi:hypothetical protein
VVVADQEAVAIDLGSPIASQRERGKDNNDYILHIKVNFVCPFHFFFYLCAIIAT